MFNTRHTLALLASLIACQPIDRAHAAGSLYLAWNDCPLGPTAAQNRSNACDANTGESQLIVAFSVPQVVDSVLALEISLDLQHAAPTLPAWWMLEPTGCRAGAMHADADFGSLQSCEDLWPGSEVGGLQVYAVGQPRGGPNQARMRIAMAVLLQDRRILAAAAIYYAARVAITNVNTIGGQACAGCETPACFVLNDIMVGRPPGSPSGNVLVQTPGTVGSNWATWQGGSGPTARRFP